MTSDSIETKGSQTPMGCRWRAPFLLPPPFWEAVVAMFGLHRRCASKGTHRPYCVCVKPGCPLIWQRGCAFRQRPSASEDELSNQAAVLELDISGSLTTSASYYFHLIPHTWGGDRAAHMEGDLSASQYASLVRAGDIKPCYLDTWV